MHHGFGPPRPRQERFHAAQVDWVGVKASSWLGLLETEMSFAQPELENRIICAMNTNVFILSEITNSKVIRDLYSEFS